MRDPWRPHTHVILPPLLMNTSKMYVLLNDTGQLSNLFPAINVSFISGTNIYIHQIHSMLKINILFCLKCAMCHICEGMKTERMTIMMPLMLVR